MQDEFEHWPDDAARIARAAGLGSYGTSDEAMARVEVLELAVARLTGRLLQLERIALIATLAQVTGGAIWWLWR